MLDTEGEGAKGRNEANENADEEINRLNGMGSCTQKTRELGRYN